MNTVPPSAEPRGRTTFRQLSTQDADAVAALHAAAFPSFFLSDLGVRFLEELYRAFAEDARCVSVVALDGDHIVGVAAGPTDSDRFLPSLAKRRFLRFSLAVAPRVIRRPALVARVLRRLAQGGVSAPEHPALLSTLCVSTGCQGQGIGKQLLAEWCRRVYERGASRVHLTTDADDNQRTIEFYQRAGWTLSSTLETAEGRRMHLMTIDLPNDHERR